MYALRLSLKWPWIFSLLIAFFFFLLWPTRFTELLIFLVVCVVFFLLLVFFLCSILLTIVYPFVPFLLTTALSPLHQCMPSNYPSSNHGYFPRHVHFVFLLWPTRLNEYNIGSIWIIKRKCFHLRVSWFILGFMTGSVLLIVLLCLCCVFCVVCLRYQSCVQWFQCLWIVYSWLSLWFYPRFIFRYTYNVPLSNNAFTLTQVPA